MAKTVNSTNVTKYAKIMSFEQQNQINLMRSELKPKEVREIVVRIIVRKRYSTHFTSFFTKVRICIST